MKHQIVTPKPLNVMAIAELCEDIADNRPLKALGALLVNMDAEVEYFTGDSDEASDLRFGLNQLLEMIQENQKQKAEEIYETLCRTPECIISRARTTAELARQGASTTDRAITDVQQALANIRAIEFEIGLEDYPAAVAVRAELTALYEALVSQRSDQEVTNVRTDQRSA